tara:strand:+ start:121 stop:300 length:180 start_codon:yes stop_codon:yes gene_type:complete
MHHHHGEVPAAVPEYIPQPEYMYNASPSATTTTTPYQSAADGLAFSCWGAQLQVGIRAP